MLGSKDIYLHLEEDSQDDSDASMRGKVFHRWVGKETEKNEESEDIDEEEDDEDAQYYANRTFERKECNIVVESSEESNEAQIKDNEEQVIIDSSDEEEKTSNANNLNFSWAPQSGFKEITDDEIGKMVAEEDVETASTTVHINDEDLYHDEEIHVAPVEIHESPEHGDEAPIEIEDSPVPDNFRQMFSSDEKENTNVIEIESDEEKSPEKAEPIIPSGKILFSSMFSASSNEEDTEEILEIVDDVQDEEPEEEKVEEAAEAEDVFVPTSGITKSYSYDVTAAEVDTGRQPTTRVLVDDNLDNLDKDDSINQDDLKVHEVIDSVKTQREEGDMRDLLDNVSTTATRASSIAGSLLDIDSRAGSVIGESFQLVKGKTFSFSEPLESESDVLVSESTESLVPETSGVKFSFSEPLNTSQVMEIDEIKDADESSHKEVLGENAQIEVEEAMSDDEADKSAVDASDDSTDDNDEEEGGEGLNFSWTKIAPVKDVNVTEIVDQEIAAGMTFAAPIVEADESVEDINDSQFDFEDPKDESMIVEEDEATDDVITKDKPEEVPKDSTITVELEIAPKQSDNNEKLIRDNTEEKGIIDGPLLVDLKEKEDSPKEPLKKVFVAVETLKTPEKETDVKTTPLRRSSRKSSRADDSLIRAETLPNEQTDSIKAVAGVRKLLRTTVVEPVVDEEVGSLEPIVEERSSEERSLSQKTTIEAKSLLQVSTETTSDTITEDQGDQVQNVDKSSVPLLSREEERRDQEESLNVTEAVTKNAAKKNKVLEKIETAVLEENKTPATPIRRSRRLSGVTPSLTPVLSTRGRKVSGALNKTSTDTPTILENQESKFDVLELRNRDVVETFSLTENFGSNIDAMDSKPKGRGGRRSSIASPDVPSSSDKIEETPSRKSSRASSRKVATDTGIDKQTFIRPCY